MCIEPPTAARGVRVYRQCATGSAGAARRPGELELGPAAGAQRVVEQARSCRRSGSGGAARRTRCGRAPRRPARGRRDRRDQEPEEERAALDPPDDPAGQAEEEGDDEEGHGAGRSEQRAHRPDDGDRPRRSTTTNQATPATMPMTTLNRIQAATARTTTARMRAPNEGPVFSFSMPPGYSRAGPGGAGFSRSVRRRCSKRLRAGRAAVELQAGEPVAADLRGVGIALRDGVAALDEQDACGGDGGGGAHGVHGGARRPSRPPPAGPKSLLTAWPGCPGAARRPRPASSAGRIAGASRRRTRQRAPLNARLATVAKPSSSARSASSRWAMRSPLGRSGSLTPHAVAVRRAARRGRTSSAPAGPTSQTPRRPRSSTSPVRACSSRASWPTRSPSSPTETRLGLGRRAAGLAAARRWPRAGRRARG